MANYLPDQTLRPIVREYDTLQRLDIAMMVDRETRCPFTQLVWMSSRY
jgi:hypothetical protein